MSFPEVRPGETPAACFDPVPNGNLPPMPYRDMPEPLPLGKVLGPSVILAGLGVGSGEYIIWPYMASTVGLGFLWAAVLSVTVQYFLNMEIERYTLATGETAVAGFVRFWKPWGVMFCLFTVLPNMWPGWGTSGVTIFSFLIGGGNVPLMTCGLLVAAGIALTVSPVVYQTLERAQFFKVGLTLVFLAVAIVMAIGPSAWAELPSMITEFGRLPDTNILPVSLVLSGLVFAGAGGVNNLAQSNWIRDKGFGMGAYIPRIVSPITGEEVAAPATGSMLRQDPENLRRFQGWWAVANKEQLVSFWFICIFSITVFSTLAYSTLHGQPITDGANLGFILAEGQALKAAIAPWFGTFFWVFGALSLMLVSLGVLDYVSRIVADVIKTVYLTDSQRWSESRIYFIVVWSTVAAGSIILLSGINQPLLLLVIAACLNGMVMFVYSILLIQLNRRGLPPALRVARPAARHAGVRDAVLRLLLGLAGHRPGAELPGIVRMGASRRTWPSVSAAALEVPSTGPSTKEHRGHSWAAFLQAIAVGCATTEDGRIGRRSCAGAGPARRPIGAQRAVPSRVAAAAALGAGTRTPDVVAAGGRR